MPLALFADRCFSALNLMTFLLYGAFGGAMLLIPYVLIEAGGYSPVQAGLALLPLPILLGARLAADGQARRADRPALPLTIGPIVVAAGLLLGHPDRRRPEPIGPTPSRRSSSCRSAWRSPSRR